MLQRLWVTLWIAACVSGCESSEPKAADAAQAQDASGVATDLSADLSHEPVDSATPPEGADLSIAVMASTGAASASTPLTYTITASNAGPADAESVTVVSQLPASATFQTVSGTGWTCTTSGQQVTCTTATIASGASSVLSIGVTTPSTSGAIVETSTISASTTDPVPTNNTAMVTTNVSEPADLSIALTPSQKSTPVSSALSYALAVTNLGPADATNLTVTNTLPANATFQSATGTGWTCAFSGQIVTCTRPSLTVGAAPTITIATTAPSASGNVVDQASVAATTADPDTGNNTAMATTSVFDSADLALTATETPNPARVGTSITYTLTVTNHGPSDAASVALGDTLPTGVSLANIVASGWNCFGSGVTVTISCSRATLPSGSSSSITIFATAASTPETMTNTAQVDATTYDPDNTNNSATTTSSANLFADLSLSISDSPDPVQGTAFPGCNNNDCVAYTTLVTNAGPDAATGVGVTFQLPSSGSLFNVVGSGWVCPAPSGTQLTCTRASTVASGANAPNITLVWKAPSPGGFSIKLSGTVSATSTDPNTANNTASQDTTVLP